MHFKKILFILFCILIVEAFLIYNRNDFAYNRYAYNINKSSSDYIIIIDSTSNCLAVFKNGKLFKTYVVATGKPSTPSPIGTWKIVNKDTWGEGFGGRWMGFNVPWGRYGIHGTIFPNSIGWNSSHGCIRMKNKDVRELYKYIPIGTNVIVWSGNYGRFGEYLRVLRPGMRGSDIYQLQLMLKEKGYYNRNPDGIYGDYFKSVIHKVEKENGLPISDYIGKSFYSKLDIYLID